MTEEDKAGFVCKRLLQRVDQDPEALKMFVKILMVKQAKFRPVILELGGGKYAHIALQSVSMDRSMFQIMQMYQPWILFSQQQLRHLGESVQ